jgi:ribulose-phosphate 3-epimerase
MIQIIPSILTNDPAELRSLLKRCEGVAEMVSIDVIDGKFADNTTIDPLELADIDTQLKIDYQLMVVEPFNWIEKCVKGKAYRIIGHVERMSNQQEFVREIKKRGLRVGLALDLSTSIEKIEEVHSELDVVLLMSVKAGFGGQEFDESVLDKIARLKHIRDKKGLSYKIHVDGGMTMEKVEDVHYNGADEVSVGRKLFEGDLQENIEKFQKAAHKLPK